MAQILRKTLEECLRKRKERILTQEDKIILKQFKLVDDEDMMIVDNYTRMSNMNEDAMVQVVDGVLVEWDNKAQGDRHAESSGKKSEDEEEKLEGKKISSNADALAAGFNESFQLDIGALRTQLEAYLSQLPKEEEGYIRGEINILHFGESPVADVMALISSGTKVLDSITYCACRRNNGEVQMFTCRQVKSLSARMVASNLDNAKKSLKSAVVLFWTQGSLPTLGQDEKKQIPKFVKEFIYKRSSVTGNEIANHLSSASTLKFPAGVFLEINIDLLPSAVAARCKLSIAGNRAVRYAVYAHTMEKQQRFSTRNESEMDMILSRNARLENANRICNFLVSLNGNHTAQARMHPMASRRPVVKNLTLKLTRAIIESLTPNGRLMMRKRIIDANNNAFQIDKNFFGSEVRGEPAWLILDDMEADFNDLSVEALRQYYGCM